MDRQDCNDTVGLVGLIFKMSDLKWKDRGFDAEVWIREYIWDGIKKHRKSMVWTKWIAPIKQVCSVKFNLSDDFREDYKKLKPIQTLYKLQFPDYDQRSPGTDGLNEIRRPHISNLFCQITSQSVQPSPRGWFSNAPYINYSHYTCTCEGSKVTWRPRFEYTWQSFLLRFIEIC